MTVKIVAPEANCVLLPIVQRESHVNFTQLAPCAKIVGRTLTFCVIAYTQ